MVKTHNQQHAVYIQPGLLPRTAPCHGSAMSSIAFWQLLNRTTLSHPGASLRPQIMRTIVCSSARASPSQYQNPYKPPRIGRYNFTPKLLGQLPSQCRFSRGRLATITTSGGTITAPAELVLRHLATRVAERHLPYSLFRYFIPLSLQRRLMPCHPPG